MVAVKEYAHVAWTDFLLRYFWHMLWNGSGHTIASITAKLIPASQRAKDYDGDLNPIHLPALDGLLADMEREVAEMRKRIQKLHREASSARNKGMKQAKILLDPLRGSRLE